MEEIKPDKKPTGQVLLYVNVVLFIGLAILYIVVFGHKTPETKVTGSQTVQPGRPLKIAFVNSDSILVNYKMAIIKKNELEAKSNSLQAEITQKQKAFEKDANYFQEQVNKNALSQQSAQEIYEELMKEQQKIYSLQDQYSAELSQNEMDINMMLLDTLTNFLKRYNIPYGYDYILGFNKAGNIFLTNEKYDITDAVIEGLNKEYDIRYGKK
jgi:outer membrane protein